MPEAKIESDFNQVSRRTDLYMRSIFELCLHACIVTRNEEICRELLTFGRANTFLMVIHQSWLKTALSYFKDYN